MSFAYLKHWTAAAMLAGMAIVGTTPVRAADTATSCSQTGVKWAPVQQIVLGPETTLTGIWSSQVSISVYCTDSGQQLPLQGASFAVEGYSKTIPDLHATIDGSDPTFATQSLPIAQYAPGSTFIVNQPLVLGTLTSDAGGNVSFTMRASSQSQPALSPDGSSTEIGLDMQMAYATPGPSGTDLPIWMLGGGQIFAATPELDSLALFGSGAAALAGYAVMRIRSRRRY